MTCDYAVLSTTYDTVPADTCCIAIVWCMCVQSRYSVFFRGRKRRRHAGWLLLGSMTHTCSFPNKYCNKINKNHLTLNSIDVVLHRNWSFLGMLVIHAEAHNSAPSLCVNVQAVIHVHKCNMKSECTCQANTARHSNLPDRSRATPMLCSSSETGKLLIFFF